MKKTIVVWEPGTEVQLPENLTGQISSVQIHPSGNVRYEVGWWKEHNRFTTWLSDGEFEVGSPDAQIRIGFKTGEKKE